MREFGKPKDGQEPVRAPVNYAFPHSPVNGELFYTDALIRQGLHVFHEGWHALAKRGENVFVSGIMSAQTKVYCGIRTKIGLHYSRDSNWLNYDKTSGHFTVPEEYAGTYLLMAQVTHDASNGNLFIMRNGEIIGFSALNGATGVVTQTAYCVEPLNAGESIQLYFMTMDEEATLFNDYYNTRLDCVKLK